MSQSNDFVRVLGECRGGLVARSLDQELEKLINAVQYSGKKGTITLQLSFDPHGVENREIHVTAKTTVKAPPEPGLDERSIFFAARGQLVRHDPLQRQLYSGPESVKNSGGEGEEEAAQQETRPARAFSNA